MKLPVDEASSLWGTLLKGQAVMILAELSPVLKNALIYGAIGGVIGGLVGVIGWLFKRGDKK